jgi:uncharacterized protein YukE
MTADEIRVNYTRMLSQAEELSQCADLLRKIRTEKLESEICEMAAAWEGDISRMCMQKARALAMDLEENEGKLRTDSARLQRKAHIFYITEMQALEIAQARGY